MCSQTDGQRHGVSMRVATLCAHRPWATMEMVWLTFPLSISTGRAGGGHLEPSRGSSCPPFPHPAIPRCAPLAPESLALPFKVMVDPATSLFPLARKFPEGFCCCFFFFRRNGMRLLVLSPQDSRGLSGSSGDRKHTGHALRDLYSCSLRHAWAWRSQAQANPEKQRTFMEHLLYAGRGCGGRGIRHPLPGSSDLSPRAPSAPPSGGFSLELHQAGSFTPSSLRQPPPLHSVPQWPVSLLHRPSTAEILVYLLCPPH